MKDRRKDGSSEGKKDGRKEGLSEGKGLMEAKKNRWKEKKDA